MTLPLGRALIRTGLTPDAMTIIGTEHDLKPEWIKVAKMVHEDVRGKGGA